MRGQQHDCRLVAVDSSGEQLFARMTKAQGTRTVIRAGQHQQYSACNDRQMVVTGGKLLPSHRMTGVMQQGVRLVHSRPFARGGAFFLFLGRGIVRRGAGRALGHVAPFFNDLWRWWVRHRLVGGGFCGRTGGGKRECETWRTASRRMWRNEWGWKR